MAKFLLPVETIMLLHLNFLGGKIHLFLLLLLSLSFDITGILTCSWKKKKSFIVSRDPCHLTSQIVFLPIALDRCYLNRTFCGDGDVLYLCCPLQ